MKKLQVFLIVLLSSSITANACGFFPFGEELRYCFFKPELYDFTGYSAFDYSSDGFREKSPYQIDEVTANDNFWFTYCKGKVDLTSVKQAVYKIKQGDICKESKNEMIKYLFAIKDNEAIAYLKFAKDCEYVNGFYSDPWEREQTGKPHRNIYIDKAVKISSTVRDAAIRQRYIFLAIRMAFYNEDMVKVRELYDAHFSNTPKDMVYYWSLYFRAIAETDKPLAYFYAAQVFANSPEKRFPVYLNFYNKIPLSEVLKHAKTEKEKANVYLLNAIVRPDRCLNEIEKIYKANPDADGLSFLLLREVNKIEDWVYTPYYSYFEPTVNTWYVEGDDDYSVKTILSRAENDRAYAGKVLNFIRNANRQKVNNAQFWNMAQVQLELITRQYSRALSTISLFEKEIDSKTPQYSELEKIKALALTACQTHGRAIIPETVKPVLIKYRNDQKFIFAIGRELEYLGDTDDAVLLFAHLRGEPSYGEGGVSNSAFWVSKKDKGYYENFFYEYFDYINVNYSPEQVQSLITTIADNKGTDNFSVWKYSALKNQRNELYDLLGTKYIRQNKLHKAAESFAKVDGLYLSGANALWERTDKYYNYFDANPFYQIKYTPDFIPVKDSKHLNKLLVTKQLISYLDKANDPKEKDRDYYYFLVANCYFNMTQFGNSWMMRRYFWTTDYSYSIPGDETEYRDGVLAKKYYNLAWKNAKTPRFKALCLRMVGYCEASASYNWYSGDTFDPLEFAGYAKLKKEYPAYYDELSNCTAFSDYFKARR